MAGRSMTKKSANKWAIDLVGRPKYVLERQFQSSSDLPAPLGYTEHRVQHEPRDLNSTHLVAKKTWDIALGPFKQIPMNLFIMYMAGNSISIFPIMMVGMMFLRPVKALLAIKSIVFVVIPIYCIKDGEPLCYQFVAYKALEGDHDTAFLQKVIYLLGNIALVFLALYKCQSMGLLPTATSDWLEFMERKTRLEYSGGGFTLQT